MKNCVNALSGLIIISTTWILKKLKIQRNVSMPYAG